MLELDTESIKRVYAKLIKLCNKSVEKDPLKKDGIAIPEYQVYIQP